MLRSSLAPVFGVFLGLSTSACLADRDLGTNELAEVEVVVSSIQGVTASCHGAPCAQGEGAAAPDSADQGGPTTVRGPVAQLVIVGDGGGGPPAPPPAPTSFSVTTVRERVLGFRFIDRASDESSFTVEELFGGTWSFARTLAAKTGTGGTVSFSVDDLDSEQDYCYRVRANGPGGSSSFVTACGRTAPLDAVDPGVPGGPGIVTIEHPAAGALRVIWVDVAGSSEWTVKTSVGGVVTGVATVRDHRTPPATRQSLTLTGLTPGVPHCFTVSRPGLTSNLLCEAPRAARTARDQRDPRPDVLPRIASLIVPRNGRIGYTVQNTPPAYAIERVAASTGLRRTIQFLAGFPAGEYYGLDYDMVIGETYCYRAWTYNPYGSRYSDFACIVATASAPTRPNNLRLVAQTGRDLVIGWDFVNNSDSYEMTYLGERQSYVDHDGTKTTTSTTIDLRGFDGFEYCFKVRARNSVGNSDWAELCGIRVVGDGTVSYGDLLRQVAPGLVTFSHRVDPGVGPAARLTKVSVAGNGFTPYVVRFISSGDCESNPSDGVVVAPGAALEAGGMATLYGAAQPALPLTLVACKGWRDGGQQPNLDPMPIQVNYQR
jgi:hypothetical protein